MRATKSSQRKQRSKSTCFANRIEPVVKAIPFPIEIGEEVNLAALDISAISADYEGEAIEIEEPKISTLVEAGASFIYACEKQCSFMEEDDELLMWDENEVQAAKTSSPDFTTISGIKLFPAKNKGTNPIFLALEEAEEAASLIQYSLDDTSVSETSLISADSLCLNQKVSSEDTLMTKQEQRVAPGYLKGTFSSAKKRRSRSSSPRASKRIFRCA